MKRKSILIFIVFLFCTNAATIQAAWLTMTMGQPKAPDLKGWKVYYAVHVTADAPTPPVSKTAYDNVTEWIGFSAADTIVPIAERQWGVKIIPYPGYETTHWEATLTFYLPGTIPEEEKTVYFVATSTGFSGAESDDSGVYPFPVEAPGKPATPEIGYKHIAVKTVGTTKSRLSPVVLDPASEQLQILSVRVFQK